MLFIFILYYFILFVFFCLFFASEMEYVGPISKFYVDCLGKNLSIWIYVFLIIF